MERGGDQGPGALSECALRGTGLRERLAQTLRLTRGLQRGCVVWPRLPRNVASGAQRDVLMAVVYGGVGENTPASCSRDSPG